MTQRTTANNRSQRPMAALPKPGKPANKVLVQSWTNLWQTKLQGDHAALKQAVEDHVSLFEQGDRSDARARAQKALAVPLTGDAKEIIKSQVRRGNETLRTQH